VRQWSLLGGASPGEWGDGHAFASGCHSRTLLSEHSHHLFPLGDRRFTDINRRPGNLIRIIRFHCPCSAAAWSKNGPGYSISDYSLRYVNLCGDGNRYLLGRAHELLEVISRAGPSRLRLGLRPSFGPDGLRSRVDSISTLWLGIRRKHSIAGSAFVSRMVI